jgi:hypothetical protein
MGKLLFLAQMIGLDTHADGKNGKNSIDKKTDFGDIYRVDFMDHTGQEKRHRTQACNCKE